MTTLTDDEHDKNQIDEKVEIKLHLRTLRWFEHVYAKQDNIKRLMVKQG